MKDFLDADALSSSRVSRLGRVSSRPNCCTRKRPRHNTTHVTLPPGALAARPALSLNTPPSTGLSCLPLPLLGHNWIHHWFSPRWPPSPTPRLSSNYFCWGTSSNAAKCGGREEGTWATSCHSAAVLISDLISKLRQFLLLVQKHHSNNRANIL